MSSGKTSEAAETAAVESASSPWYRGLRKDLITEGTLIGAALGAGVGFWAATTRKSLLLHEEQTILLAVVGSAVGLLAVALTAMTLVIVFLSDDFFGGLIEKLGVGRFFRPFVVIVIVSAGAALVSFAGAIDAYSHNARLRDITFGIAAWLIVWAFIGTVHLVFTLVGYAGDSLESKTVGTDDSEWRERHGQDRDAQPGQLGETSASE